MRLREQQQNIIKSVVSEIAGNGARVLLFGSRLDDNAKGGDIDLMVDLPTDIENPVQLAVTLEVRLSRKLDDRKVDVLINAPNQVQQPIHRIAQATGRWL